MAQQVLRRVVARTISRTEFCENNIHRRSRFYLGEEKSFKDGIEGKELERKYEEPKAKKNWR